MVKAVFDELAAERPTQPLHRRDRRRRHPHQPGRTTRRSRPSDADGLRAVFYGLGATARSGPTRTRSRSSARSTDLFAQGYFVYDSKKSGSMTVSHLRFGPRPIRSHLPDRPGRPPSSPATSSTSSSASTCSAGPPTGRPSCSTAPTARRGLGPAARRGPAGRSSTSGLRPVRDRRRPGRPRGRPGRPDQHRDADLLLRPRRACCRATRRSPRIKAAIAKTYGKRGEVVVERNIAAVDGALGGAAAGGGAGRRRPATRHRRPTVSEQAPDFVQRVTARMLAGKGDLLPVSALPVDGTFPTGTARSRSGRSPPRSRSGTRRSASMRQVRDRLPAPAIRMKVYDPGGPGGRPGRVRVQGSFRAASCPG